jgi:hypothetical protein
MRDRVLFGLCTHVRHACNVSKSDLLALSRRVPMHDGISVKALDVE